MRNTFLVSILSFVGLCATASIAHAQPANKGKVQRACGETVIPLAVGHEWVYKPITPLGQPPPNPNDAKKYPPRAKQITIDVVGIETANNVTTVQLQEDVDGHKLKTSITCTADKFTVDPQSFFFAGEPGGAYHLEFTDFQHKDGTTLKLAGGKLSGPDWRDDVIGSWKQTPTQGADAKLWQGKLEIERAFKIAGTDDITTSLDGQAHTFAKAQKVTLDITGRITLDPPDPNPSEFPDGYSNTFWFADDIGVVQTQNSYGPPNYGHTYQLVSVKLQK